MNMQQPSNILSAVIFAIAMAYLESAVVVYLRAMYGIEDLLLDINLAPDMYTVVEIGREAATLVMLAVVGIIAASSWSKRIGFFFLAFGVWDIFYYIWLYIFIQWPKSLFEWDILFLIPLPWWGPVITPVLISILLIFIGYMLIMETIFKIKLLDWILIVSSVIILLFTFVEDSIHVILSGSGDIASVRPSNFNWILFGIAYLTWFFISIKMFLPGFKE